MGSVVQFFHLASLFVKGQGIGCGARSLAAVMSISPVVLGHQPAKLCIHSGVCGVTYFLSSNNFLCKSGPL